MERILVVDDDQTTRERLGRILEKEGLDVLLAQEGGEALNVFEKERPGIVITDLKMPNIDGMEVLHGVKKMDPTAQVILMTARGDYDLAIHALRGGALDYLRKPIDLEDLFIALGRAKENLANYREQSPVSTILVIDDDEMARNKLARVLSKEGYNVVTASDGEEGIKRFEETKVDIILADLKMPKKGGLEVLRAVRHITQDVETIVVTGYGDEETAIQAMREGAVNYLRKPVDLAHMFMAIEKAIETLHLKRSVLFRRRDLELAREVVAKITSRKELVVDVRDGARKSAIDFAESLVDAVPLSLLVVDHDLNVLFANRAVRERAGADATTASSDLFAKMGLSGLSVDTFSGVVKKVYSSPGPLVECIEVSQFAFVIVTKLFVLMDEGTRKVVLSVLRGERREVVAPIPERGDLPT